MQLKVTARQNIRRPAEDVWALVSDVERMPQWVTNVMKAERTSNRKWGAGSTFRAETRYRRFTTKLTYTATAFAAPHRFSYQAEGGAKAKSSVEHTIQLQPVRGGTRLTKSVTISTKRTKMFGGPRWLMLVNPLRFLFASVGFAFSWPSLYWDLRRYLSRDLAKARRVLEAGEGSLDAAKG